MFTSKFGNSKIEIYFRHSAICRPTMPTIIFWVKYWPTPLQPLSLRLLPPLRQPCLPSPPPPKSRSPCHNTSTDKYTAPTRREKSALFRGASSTPGYPLTFRVSFSHPNPPFEASSLIEGYLQARIKHGEHKNSLGIQSIHILGIY